MASVAAVGLLTSRAPAATHNRGISAKPPSSAKHPSAFLFKHQAPPHPRAFFLINVHAWKPPQCHHPIAISGQLVAQAVSEQALEQPLSKVCLLHWSLSCAIAFALDWAAGWLVEEAMAVAAACTLPVASACAVGAASGGTGGTGTAAWQNPTGKQCAQNLDVTFQEHIPCPADNFITTRPSFPREWDTDYQTLASGS